MTPSAPIVGIAADDVTGATDSVVQFSRTGWSARLLLGELLPDLVEPGSALAVNTDARAMDSATAREATASAIRNLVTAGADRLYLKIDSTMRGSVQAQVAGALDAWQEHHPGSFAVVCPAYPAMGRTLEDGLLRVHGGPVEDSPAGRDPVTPVPTSEFSQLLPGTTTISLSGSPEQDAQALRDAAGDGVVVVNAASDDDLRTLAAALVVAGPTAIPAGSAGLAAAMAAAWADAGAVQASLEPAPARQGQRIVVVVSSLHDVARAQTDHLRAQLDPADLRVLQPDESLLDQPNRLAQWAAGELEVPESLPRVVVITTPEAVGGSALTLSGAAIASSLASVVQQTLARASVGALVLVGGDGARAVLDATRAQALRITGAIQEGIPVGIVEGGTAAGKIVVTKAGGFGAVTALLDTVTELTRTLTPTLAHSTEASS
ncbi:four-carbon acid sugar kinase family protein [Arthrobacter sp. NamB2]|uniref:four-carbon acid sugar kinase family protein n=1 Tax=Arthrobacter sp. NamB2 TaxID=2576035 RepID=UPI0010CA0CD8|nr:four-carbon acid sugar kinase family protein [Arthrobacter sp. NamB2]TKV28565.1 four-carbon acid sugar kinase family protein [Arthrobacter sp. NamB2]